MLVALDPGFGNTKVAVDGKTTTIQTAVAHPNAIGLAATGLHSSSVKTIQIDSTTYVVGSRAWLHGEPITSLDYNALASPERRAIFFQALGELLRPAELLIDPLVVGLPVPLLQDRSQAEAAFAGLRSYKGRHVFTLGSNVEPHIVTIQSVKVLAQPVGAYADWLIDSDLHLRKNAKDAEAAVLDIGLNTIDLYALRGGEVEPRFVSGAKMGVRRLLASLDGAHDMEESDADLRSGRLRANDEQMSAWLGEIMAIVERAWPALSRFSAVIPTGGGALVLGDLLRGELARRGAAVAWPDDPITANVRGLWKWYARPKHELAETLPTAAPKPLTPNPLSPDPKPRRGPKPKPQADHDSTPGKRGRKPGPRCTFCHKGNPGEDGLCTQCRHNANKARIAAEEKARIERIVEASRARNDVGNLLHRAAADGTISASKLG